MKTKIFRISKQSISLLLSILMIVSMTLVGVVSVSAWSSLYIIGGPAGNDWNTGNISYPFNQWYDSNNGNSGRYYREITLTNGQYFALSTGSGNRLAPSTTSDLKPGINAIQVFEDTSNYKSFKYTGTTGKVRICIDQSSGGDKTPYVWIEEIPSTTSNWYLRGYLNNGDVTTNLSQYKFSATSTPNVYELTVSFTSGGSQYLTMHDGSTLYAPSSYQSLAENTTSTAGVANGNEKWGISPPLNTDIVISWNSSTKKISWAKAVEKYNVSKSSDLESGASLKFSETADGSAVSEFEENATVYVTVTPPTGYDCTGVTYTYNDTTAKATGSDNSYTFLMPPYATTVDATFEAKTYNITYNTTSGLTYKTQPTTAQYGDTVTVEFTIDDGYICTGVTGGNNGSYSDGTYKFTMPDDDVTIDVKIVENKSFNITATVNDATMGSVDPTSQTVTVGTTVTVTANANSGYEFVSWTVTGLNSSQPTLTNSTLSFEVQASDDSTITVKANFAEESHGACNYRIVGNPALKHLTNGWTGSYDDAKEFETYVKDGVYKTTIVVPHTDNGRNQFKLINSSNKQYCAKTNYNILDNTTEEEAYEAKVFSESKPFEFGQTGRYDLYINDSGDNPKIWAVKSTDRVLINDDFNVVGSFDANGELVLNLPAGTSEKYFVVDADGYMHINGGGIIDESGSLNLSMYNNLFDKPNYFTHNASFSGRYTFTISNDNNKITVSLENAGNYVKIYAKDGTIRGGYNKYSKLADTEFTDTTKLISVNTDADKRQEAYADLGTTISVKTTIEDDYRSKYYVRGFNVNGETYNITTKTQADSNTTGEYTLTYTIPEDFEGDSIEITPVYFYKDESNTITFYVEGFDDTVKEQWGDIIACHAYYNGIEDNQNDDNSEEGKNALGGYPGQPMIYEGGKYYMQIPKSLIVDKSVKTFKGITLNNYVWDDVHKERVGGTGNNCQTYDYNDLAVIAERGEADNIIFSFKYEINHNNEPDETPDNNRYENVYTNGWENLTDHNQRDVDLFGNLLTNEQIETHTRLRIVSQGYVDNYIGDYATEWTIYAYENNSWIKVGTLSSSALLYETLDKLKAAIGENHNHVTAYEALEAYRNYPAEITYEKSIINSSGSIGNRSDGRWYYSQLDEVITVNTRIEYASNMEAFKSGNFTVDTYKVGTAQGSYTGTKAYFTGDFEGMTTATGRVDNNRSFTFKAETDAAGAYMFVGWYLLKEGKYTNITYDSNGYAPMSSSETYVARFINVPVGMLTVTHELYKNAPEIDGMLKAHTGTGTCYAQVDVYNASNTLIYTYDKTTNPIVIKENHIRANSSYKLKITLTTDINGLSEFWEYYVNTLDAGGYKVLFEGQNKNKTGQTSIVLEFEVAKLFDPSQVEPVFFVDALNFYSDIVPVTKDYKLTFNYNDRFDVTKSYVVKGTLSEDYIDKNLVDGNVVLTNEFIMDKAPYEDNFGKTITWDENNITKSVDGDVLTATIGSTQAERNVVVNYKTTGDIDNEAWKTITLSFGSLVMKDPNGSGEEYVCVADSTYDNLKFSHWEIYTDSTLTNLVAKCYYNEFNFRAFDNYYIIPKYAETPELSTVENVSTTIDFLEYSRNQWTDDEGIKQTSTDKLYADFNLAFNYNGKLMSTVENVECGMVLEVCGKIEQASDGSYITDLSNYSYDTNEAILKEAILNGSKKYDDGDVSRNIIKNQIANTALTNKNRIQIYQGFNNSTNNPLYVIKCYSYMIVDGTDVVLSDPVYINLYDVAHLTYTVS